MTNIASTFDRYFDTQNQKSNGTKSYDDFVSEMNAAGIKTTHLNNGEANFADYGNALSDDLKQQIMDSFDCEQDYELQSLIAGIYSDAGVSVLKSGQFVSACQSLGLSVSIQYQKTSYIPDYKAGNFGNNLKDGSIAVYTISDGMGGEIVIADANGNAALESEELFMNQILGDINYEISANKNVGASFSSGASSSSGLSGVEDTNSLFADKENADEVEQKDYNAMVEKFLEQGVSMADAVKKADTKLKVDNMTYSGSMEEKKSDVEDTAKKAAKKETNNEKIVDKTVDKTLKEVEKTEKEDVISTFATEVADEILEEVNFFAA